MFHKLCTLYKLWLAVVNLTLLRQSNWMMEGECKDHNVISLPRLSRNFLVPIVALIQYESRLAVAAERRLAFS